MMDRWIAIFGSSIFSFHFSFFSFRKATHLACLACLTKPVGEDHSGVLVFEVLAFEVLVFDLLKFFIFQIFNTF